MVRKLLITTFLAAFAALSAVAQNKEELQQQIERIQQEIKATNQLIDKTRRDQKESNNSLKLVRTQINNRREIVSSLGKQINVIDQELTDKNKTIARLGSELEQLKKDYASMIYTAYKNYKLNNFMLFVFSADDFNQATRRIDFMRRYNDLREEKARRITAVTDSIVHEAAELDRTRRELDETKESRNTELKTLAKDEIQYKNAVSRLQTQESKLAKELKAKQQEMEKAERRIQELIAEEARRNRAATTTAAEDRVLVELTGKFEQNKGKLPYPVSGGVVVDKFGEHAHATVKNSKIVNQGVNIAAGKGAEVISVFEGTVTAIFNASVLNNCIIVRHGDHVSVYANVVSVAVKTGDKVKFGQRLGRLSDSGDPDTHFLHFEILENGKHVNPEHWIKR